jgi:hypothetical protein
VAALADMLIVGVLAVVLADIQDVAQIIVNIHTQAVVALAAKIIHQHMELVPVVVLGYMVKAAVAKGFILHGVEITRQAAAEMAAPVATSGTGVKIHGVG